MNRSENLTGASLMILSMAAFTSNDALVKALSDSIPLFQLLFLRGVFTSLAVVLIAWKVGVVWPHLAPREWKLILVRTGAETGAAFFFFTALTNMLIANITAIMQAIPITITLAAAVFFGERVGFRRIAAISAGFVGVMLIVRPGATDFTVYSLYGLAAVALVTLRDLSTRQLAHDTPSLFVTLFTSLAMTVFFGLGSFSTDWAPMSVQDLGMTAAAAGLLIAGYQFIIISMRMGEVGPVAPFRYTGLVWAIALGWLAFGELPSMITLIGASIVVGSGIYTLLRESKLAKAERFAQTSRARPRNF